MPWTREEIAARAARELKDGQVVNLGIGLPSLVADFLDHSAQIMIQSENGLLGVGPRPLPGKANADVTNAAGEPVTVRPGGSFFDTRESFAMIRGGHIDVCVLGGLQVDQDGNLANWMIPGKMVPGMGGAMDLVVGARRVIVTMTHRDSTGLPKLVSRCGLPLTALGVVDTVVTDLGVFQVRNGAFHAVELAPDTEWEEVLSATEGNLVQSEQLRAGRDEKAPTEPAVIDEFQEDEGELVADSDWGLEGEQG